jgi:hypothetical protein
MDAHQIATLINLTADAAHAGNLPLKTASGIIRELWHLAGSTGHSAAVDAQLQEWSTAEMRTAMDALPQDGSVAI